MYFIMYLRWVRIAQLLLYIKLCGIDFIELNVIDVFLYSAEDEFGFSCKFEECAEAKEPPKPECAYQFTIDSCCAANIECDKAKIDKLPRCWSDGHEFVKGNLIYSPHAPCYKCLCDEKYNNATEVSKNPSCKPVECGIEVHQLSYLQLGKLFYRSVVKHSLCMNSNWF